MTKTTPSFPGYLFIVFFQLTDVFKVWSVDMEPAIAFVFLTTLSLQKQRALKMKN
jgi:hypothetical protein